MTATPEPAPAAPAAPDTAVPAEKSYSEAEHKAAIESAIKERFKKFEDYDSLKAAAKELEAFKASQMTETEKAVNEAKSEGRKAALREVGARLVDAEIRAAAAGTALDVAAVLEGLDRGRFLDDDGEPDTAGIRSWVERIAPKTDAAPPTFPDIAQGVTPSVPSGGSPLLDKLTTVLSNA